MGCNDDLKYIYARRLLEETAKLYLRTINALIRTCTYICSIKILTAELIYANTHETREVFEILAKRFDEVTNQSGPIRFDNARNCNPGAYRRN